MTFDNRVCLKIVLSFYVYGSCSCYQTEIFLYIPVFPCLLPAHLKCCHESLDGVSGHVGLHGVDPRVQAVGKDQEHGHPGTQGSQLGMEQVWVFMLRSCEKPFLPNR